VILLYAKSGLMNELIELHLREHVLSDLEKINEEDLNDFLALIKRYT
jgi:FrmR/RcnR family transcriptional regulator, repressor of rcnA expression